MLLRLCNAIRQSYLLRIVPSDRNITHHSDTMRAGRFRSIYARYRVCALRTALAHVGTVGPGHIGTRACMPLLPCMHPRTPARTPPRGRRNHHPFARPCPFSQSVGGVPLPTAPPLPRCRMWRFGPVSENFFLSWWQSKIIEGCYKWPSAREEKAEAAAE